MVNKRKCPACGVPILIGQELRWGEDGVIHLSRSPRNRMVLYESRIIDSVFRGVEDLIGLPIGHIVIESRRREVKKYMEGVFPAWIRRTLMFANDALDGIPGVRRLGAQVRERLGKSVAGRVFDIGRLYGYGDAEPGPLWETGDLYPWRDTVVHQPYSVFFYAAECLASVEAFEGKDHWVSIEELGEETYLFRVRPGQHPVELKERLGRKRYAFKPGNIRFDRCPECGVPREVARLEWDLERGTIIDPDNGRRMALFGPHAVDAVLMDLEAELGEAVLETVIEVQRRYVKSRVGEENWRRRGTTFARMAALRGLGYVARFEADEKHLSVTICNACMPHLDVGMAQALYEIAMGKDNSERFWSFSEDGILDITVSI